MNDPVYDRTLALHRVGGNEAVADELLRMLREDLPGQYQSLTQAFGQGDLEQVRELAHKIRGSANYCGAPALRQAADALENAILDGRSSGLEPLVTGLGEAKEALLARGPKP